MKRRRLLITGVLLLLLGGGGAIVNVAVAWGLYCRSYSSGRSETWLADQEAIDWWRQHAPAGFPDVPVGLHESYRFGGYSRMLWTPEDTYMLQGHKSQGGWPMMALEWSSWLDRSSCTVENRYAIQVQGWPFAAGTGRKLPVLPIWPGFAINTIFYAAMLWVLFAVPLALRRRRRMQRGRCPACAYPVGQSPICTECGKPLKIRTCMGLPPPATPAATDRERTT